MPIDSNTKFNDISIPKTGTTYTFENGISYTGNTAKLGGRLTANTVIDKGKYNFTIQEGIFPNLDHFFGLGTNELDSTLNGLIYAKLLLSTATILRIDTSSQYIGRSNFATGRSAGLTIKNKRTGSTDRPDIVLEVKKTAQSGRFGFSADTGSCEMFQYDPLEKRDVTFFGVDYRNRSANVYSRRKNGTIASEIMVDTLHGIKFINENNNQTGYIFPKEMPTSNQSLKATRSDSEGNMQLSWVSDCETGWAAYLDSIYTSNNPLVFTQTDWTTLPNMATDVIDKYKPCDIETFYDPDDSIFTAEEGDVYTINVSFKVRPNTGKTTLLDFAIDTGDIKNIQYAKTTAFLKGENVEQYFLSSFTTYALDTWVKNGGKPKIKTDNSVDIYDVKYEVFRIHGQ